MDGAIAGGGLVTGANAPDVHLIGVEPGRDFRYETCDVRAVEVGDLTAAGDPIEIETAIEVGNIFKLGTRYSEPLGATYLDPDGVERPIVMGSYGIGPARIVAAAVEQRADEKGISWPPPIAPWSVHLVALGKGGDEVADAAAAAYATLTEAGIETVLDDRPGAGTGEKLTDAELVGCPLRLTIGKRGLAEGVAEAQVRGSGAEEKVALAEIATRAASILEAIK
jgi:prolyl-tRNA synthetase